MLRYSQSRKELMTNKTFNADEFIEQSTDVVQRIKDYTENNTASPELVNAIKGLYSDLAKFNNALENVETK